MVACERFAAVSSRQCNPSKVQDMPGRPRGPSDGTSDWEQPECEQLRSHSIGTTAAASDLQMAATGAFAFPKGLARNGEDSDESDDDDGHSN